MAAMKTSASIFISGLRLMNSEMGSMKTIMSTTAMITARTMMMRCSARPTAVITESMEKTMSMTMIVPTACPRLMRCLAACSFDVAARNSVRSSVSFSSRMPL